MSEREIERCELYISRVQGAPEGKVVRIDLKQGRKSVAQFETDLEGFAGAIMGQGAVTAFLIKGSSTPPAVAVVPEGWQLVPKEPIEEMLRRGMSPFMAAHDLMYSKNEPCGPIYRAMLAAAPPPPQNKGEA